MSTMKQWRKWHSQIYKMKPSRYQERQSKKSAFVKSTNEHLGKVNTDVDAEVNREISKLSENEATDQEIVDCAKAQEHKKIQKRKNDQVAVASKDPPKTVIAEAPRKASKRKRSKSPEPETLREKNKLSQKEVLAIHNHDEAVNKGSCLIQYKTENKWKMALGKRKEPYQDQMALRTLKWNASYTIS